MNADEFDEFYLANYAAICNHVYALCGNRAEAEECAQEAFARAWAYRDKLDVTRSPGAWVRLTAYRLSVSSWRKWGRQRATIDNVDVVLEDPNHERRMDLLQALSTLKPNFRRALVLYYYADLSAQDVAQEIGISHDTARAWISRARKQLAETLAPKEGVQHV